jgi:hypothetical protein
MGQRSQIILILPEVYINDNNPNNRGKKLIVLHNQWLYGYSFLLNAVRLIDAIKSYVTERKTVYKKHDFDFYSRDLDAIIGYANFSDLKNQTHSSYYFDDSKNEALKMLKKAKNALEFVKSFDNNNGYLFINVDKTGEVSFDILNGLEDADEIKKRTPSEYLKLFYPEEKIISCTMWEALLAIEKLNEIKTFDGLLALDDVKKTLKKGVK